MQIVTGQVRPQSGVPLLPTPEPAREAEFAALLGGLFAALQATPPAVAARDTAPPEPGARGSTARADAPSALDVPTPARSEEAATQQAGDEPDATNGMPERAPAADEAAPAPAKEPAAAPEPVRGDGLATQRIARLAPADPAVPKTEPQAPAAAAGEVPSLKLEAPVATPPAAPEDAPDVAAPRTVVQPAPGGFRLLAPPVVETAAEAPKPVPAVDAPASQPTPAGAALPVVAVPPPPAAAAVPSEPGIAGRVEGPVAVSAAGSSSLQSVSRLERLAKPLAPGMVERVAAVVKLQASQNGGRVRMLLHPPHLGALKVDVVVRDGTVFAKMETETGAARHALQSHLGELRHALEEHGLSLGQMSVSVGQENLSGSHQGSFASPPPEPCLVQEDVAVDSRPEARRTSLLDLTV